MEPAAILDELAHSQDLPREALRAAAERRADMVPLFVQQIESYLRTGTSEHEGDTLGGIMVFRFGKTAYYLFGGSSDRSRGGSGCGGETYAASVQRGDRTGIRGDARCLPRRRPRGLRAWVRSGRAMQAP